jgi:hypothetical protein
MLFSTWESWETFWGTSTLFLKKGGNDECIWDFCVHFPFFQSERRVLYCCLLLLCFPPNARYNNRARKKVRIHHSKSLDLIFLSSSSRVSEDWSVFNFKEIAHHLADLYFHRTRETLFSWCMVLSKFLRVSKDFLKERKTEQKRK